MNHLFDRKLIIFFHANAEDIGSAYKLVNTIRDRMNVEVIVPEYPGYGIYDTVESKAGAEPLETTQGQILEDAECIYDFALRNLDGLKERNVILIGRSMGSGPSIHLASQRNPGALVLISPFRNIKSVVYESFYFLSALVQE